MTSKEKAEELVGKFMGFTYPFNQENIGKEPHIYKAKQCGLIAVDEIFKIPYLLKREKLFYKEVIKEIKKL
jgi:hypothetical protein